MIEAGLTHTSTMTVTAADTAASRGSGDMPVLATPAMMALMENAAMMAVAPVLEAGQTTVGGQIDSSHLKPTPVGAVVTAMAVLEKVEGRKLYFRISASQGDSLIGEGRHLRFVVDRERFLAKV